jgi:type VI secretion system secreted protein VgrG
MPPHKLPDNKTWSGIKTRSSKDAASDNLNEIRFEDKKGSEYFFVHGEKDMEVRVKKDRKEWIGQDRHLMVVRDKHDEVQRDYSVSITRHNKTEVSGDQHLKLTGKQANEIGGSQSLKVSGNMMYNCGGNFSVEVTGTLYLKAPTIVIEGTTGVGLKCGGSFVTLNSGGVFIKGGQVHLNSAGAALSASAGSLVPPAAPTKPQEALKPQTTDKTAAPTSGGGAGGTGGGGGGGGGAKSSAASNAPAHNAAAAENKEKKSWIEGTLVDEADQPVPGEAYEVKLPDGTTVASGTTDEKGFFRVDHIDPGQCEICFPNLDKDAWEPS